jgi:hypothetical protein
MYKHELELTENSNSVSLLQTENGNSKLLLVCCEQKQKFVFLGRQTAIDDCGFSKHAIYAV